MKVKEETNNPKSTSTIKKSVFWELFCVFSLFAIGILFVIGRLFYVQIVNKDLYVKQGKRQQQSKDTIIPQRGNIYDRNGVLLASSIRYISIAVDPTLISDTIIKKLDTTIVRKNIDSVAVFLERYKGIPKNETIKKIKQVKNENIIKEKNKQRKKQYIFLAKRISADKENSFKNLKDVGIIIETEYIRHYNYSSVAAQILGHTNDKKEGIEKQYDSILSGVSGYRYVYKDAKGTKRPALDLPTISPIDGANLYLTIDINLQEIVEFELARGVRSAAAESGTIIAMDPETGEILACASYPSYNPNDPSAYNPEAARIRSITDVFEPGSTFKAITAAAGFEEKIITKMSDMFYGYHGLYQQNTYSITDGKAFGMASFYDAFVHSSNIILADIAVKTKRNVFMKYIRDFGFGSETGIDLPGEIRGAYPDPKNVKDVDLRYLGHGYQISITPIQLVNAYSAIANNGNLLQPYIVKKIVDKDKIVMEKNKKIIRNVIKSHSTATNLKILLTGAVKEGTGTKAFIKNFKIAGKTGTAQKYKDGTYQNKKYIGSFIGFYPADKPKICMLIMIDEPQGNYYGGTIAAPIFKNIALRHAGINSDIIDDYGNKTTSLVYVPRLEGLRYETSNMLLSSLGITLTSDYKKGIIASQNPYADARIKKENDIKVYPVDLSNSTLPKVIGLPTRNAISILHSNGYKVKVSGTGKVFAQDWNQNEKICYIKCR